MKRFLKVFLAIIFVASLFLVACSNNSNDPKPDDGGKTNEISLSYTGGDIALEVGQEKTITITAKGTEELVYSVDNSEVLKVENGKITALKAGSAKITVSAKEDSTKKVEINVTVTEKAVEPTKYTITYDLDGGTATGLVTEFEENKYPNLPIPTKEGFNFLGWFEGETEVSSINANKNYTLVAKWEAVQTEILPESIEIIVEMGDDDMVYADTLCTITCKVLPDGASQEVEWKNMNKSKAVRLDDGTVEVRNGNEATFKATSVANPDVVATVTLQVRSFIKPERFLDSIQVSSDEIVAQDIRAYDSTSGYDTYLLGSVVKYLFEDLVIDSESWMLKEGAFNRPGKVTEEGNVFNLKYITVHDVGGTGDAAANARYCNNPGGREVSWHYTVGNDGIYQQIPDDEMGWHAGDGTWDPMVWYDSGILAPEGDDTPAVITWNKITNKYEINGQETLVSAPVDGNGNMYTNAKLPYTGINNYVDMDKSSSTYRHYMIGKTYYNSTYNTISNRGGNLCSI
nr:InlB B-repeat-containing protein [Bacilli bacterium]